MHTINRPVAAPEELINLANSGGEDFGPLARPLDEVFAGVCAYCERTTGDDDPDLNTRFFTCDHFEPRHLLCHHDPAVGQCVDRPPPHSADCPIYEWANLVYACQSCADAKGGQWPQTGDSADGYINPTDAPNAADVPERVFAYSINTGRIFVRDSVGGVERNNAQRTIDDLALNDPCGPRHQNTRYAAKGRRVGLAERRQTWVEGLRHILSNIPNSQQDALRFVINEHIHPSCRFSSICRQFIQESGYGQYLMPTNQSAAQS